MKSLRKKHTFFSLFIIVAIVFFIGCSNSIEPIIEEESNGCATENLLEAFTDQEGNELFIYENGEAFLQSANSCDFVLQFFEPDFETTNYTVDGTTVFLKDGNDFIAVKNEFEEYFETDYFLELFATDINDENLFWTNFTLQSPMAKEVSDYVALSKCILDQECDFRDNRIEISEDPDNVANNKVLKFSAVAPTADMVTSKCSLGSQLGFFKKTDEVWYEASYYIESGMPYSIVDFENGYFEGAPGPRIVIQNNQLALENKFGAKNFYNSNSSGTITTGVWFKLKVHLMFDNTDQGIIQIWKNDQLVLDTKGINLPTSNAIQNILEIGISATDNETVLYIDNLRISNVPF